jgi:hypothetical protein
LLLELVVGSKLLLGGLHLQPHVVDLFRFLAQAHQKLLSWLLVATKSAEANTILVLLTAADAESHARASVLLSGLAVLNLVIPS